MPVIMDALVVNSSYKTDGNGGRKLVRLSNGWIVAGVRGNDMYNPVYFYVDKLDGQGFKPLCYASVSGSGNSITLVSKGTDVYFLYEVDTKLYSGKINVLTQTNVNIFSTTTTLSVETELGEMSLAINEANAELHATWASKNSTYPNSFNIRYAKGTINANGSVTWGAVIQATKSNTVGRDHRSPTIVHNGIEAIIIYQSLVSGEASIDMRRSSDFDTTFKYIYSGGTYAQSNPSAIFVPQSINGLVNGRIWVTWHGRDSSNGTLDKIRVAYSDDGGINWSSVKTVSSSSAGCRFPSITVSKLNEVNVVYELHYDALDVDLAYSTLGSNAASFSMYSLNGDVGVQMSPSTLADVSIEAYYPLTIFMNASKVSFSGIWIVTDISPTEKHFIVDNKGNLLTYNITTDDAMSKITEKVNGVTTGTKTAKSGQALVVGLSQAQWDNVKFGKYSEFNLVPTTTVWVLGSLHGSTGAELSSTFTLRTNKLAVSPNQRFKVNINPNYRYVVRFFNGSTHTGGTNFGENPSTIVVPADVDSVRVMIQRADVGTITVQEALTAELTVVNYPKNTLSIEMGNNKWEYTFDKRLAPGAEADSVLKAVQDSNKVFLPAVKEGLVNAISSKGVTVTGDSWESIEAAIKQMS